MTDSFRDLLLEGQREGFENKNLRFEKKMVRQMMGLLGRFGPEIADLLSRAGDQPMEWFNQEYMASDLSVAASKVAKTASLAVLCRDKLEKTEVYKAWADSRQDHADRDAHALIVSRHGDGLPDLVLHNSPSMVDGRHWVMGLRTSREGDPPFWMQTLPVFLAVFKDRYAHGYG